MKIETFDSVWDAVGNTPEQTGNIRIRAELVAIVNNWAEQQGSSQAQAASALRVTQPRISELTRGKIQIFSIDELIAMVVHTGLYIRRVEIQYPHAV